MKRIGLVVGFALALFLTGCGAKHTDTGITDPQEIAIKVAAYLADGVLDDTELMDLASMQDWVQVHSLNPLVISISIDGVTITITENEDG